MTHDPQSDHWKKKAAVEPGLRAVLLDVTEIWTGN